MNTLPSLTPPPRLIPLLALALGVLLAHALLLAWLVFTPTQAPNKPEQRIEWITLQKAPLPAARPPAPPQAAAAVPPPEKTQPAPPKKHFTRPAPPHPTSQIPPAPQRPQPTKPVLPRANTPSIEPTVAPAVPPAPDLPAIAATHSAAPQVATPTVAPGPPHPGAAASAAPEPVMETAASYKAEYLDNPPPPYPRLSRQLGEEGTALLKVQVGPNGRPLQIKLMSSSGYPRLDEAAEATVAQWRFVAATRNGQSVASWVLVPIKFRILN
ncbi:putative tonB protein [Thiomonas arsenitoxydans]|uniref:TonB protein n=1 Tax=Thiomonas arsenitoxydans (strain DSM 22701 / CIP 110005 / 3As) TaxID=426114 RepID=D6CU38_THIA3|nr:TonB family protein [Thiomonas arsenitoxydans]CQR41300.1 putative tonB protein [Thiomonas sp. CB3]CAZ88807.1 putative tonB protein [Thiomonas arsenitoxydans]CQR26317.1 putative tonB protein [Thiomonas arsenitoxydans]CQR28420.1 putative tonB protein [Thiomonas arsenitoxydans]CQR35300.1 putative tonB protein [Thiomonas arsenitoxydans]